MSKSRSRPLELEFIAFDDPGLLAHMASLVARGEGWINLEPVVEEADLPERPGPFAFLTGPTHEIPTATWVPGRHTPTGDTKPTTIGLQHAGGARVAGKLRDLGLPVPDDWRVTQDHPRRGLVASVPPGADNGAVVGWLLRAAELLCATPTTGRWGASVHSGSTA